MNPFSFVFGEDLTLVTVSIYQGNELIQQQQMTMPEPLLEAQFKQLCVQLKQSGQPMKVRMSRIQWVEGRVDPIETWIEYQTWKDDE